MHTFDFARTVVGVLAMAMAMATDCDGDKIIVGNERMVERDTTAEAHRVQVQVLRRLGMRGRGALTLQMTDDMRGVLVNRIAHERPALDERARVRALVAYLYGESLAAKAFDGRESMAGA